jgi:hypothetical protein
MISLPIKRGEFMALSSGSGTVTSGVVNLLITPSLGQRVRLTSLSTTEGSVISSVSIIFGSTTLITANLNGGVPDSPNFSVGSFQSYAAGNPPNGNHKYVTGKVDEALNITSASGIGTDLYYAYEFGE